MILLSCPCLFPRKLCHSRLTQVPFAVKGFLLTPDDGLFIFNTCDPACSYPFYFLCKN